MSYVSNAAFSTDPKFQAACAKAKEVYGVSVEPTAAQASKYRRGFGAAYTAEHGLPLGSKVKAKCSSEAAMEAGNSARTARPSRKPELGYGPYTPPAAPKQDPKKKAAEKKAVVALTVAAVAVNQGNGLLADVALEVAEEAIKELKS